MSPARERRDWWGLRQQHGRLLTTATLGAAVLLSATACAPEPAAPSPSASPTPTATQTPAPPTPTTTPTTAPTTPAPAQPIVLPACAELMTEQQARDFSGQDAYVLLDADAVANLSGYIVQNTLGPAAATALATSEQSVSCGWGIPNSGAYVQVFGSVLDPAAQAALRAELDASDYVSGTEGDAATYSLAIPGGIANQFVWYAFEGDVWIAEVGVTDDPAFGRAVLDAVRSANPSGLAR